MPHFANSSQYPQRPSFPKDKEYPVSWEDLFFPPVNLHNYPNHTPMNNEVKRQEDVVNSPSHYKQGNIECIDAIKAALTPEEFLGYCKGNIMKYMWRERHKGGVESRRKAAWYLKQVTHD